MLAVFIDELGDFIFQLVMQLRPFCEFCRLLFNCLCILIVFYFLFDLMLFQTLPECSDLILSLGEIVLYSFSEGAEGLRDFLKTVSGLGSIKLGICMKLFEFFLERISRQEKILNEIIEA